MRVDNSCASRPCLNGATCVDTKPNYLCLCANKFDGRHCEYRQWRAKFTNLGAEGRTGPKDLGHHYTGQDHDGLVTLRDGIQYFSVPHSGQYMIQAAGAAGGTDRHSKVRSHGAFVQGTFNLTKGTILKILIGQMGGFNEYGFNSGGGGGTFVATEDNEPLIVAGGGGGRNNLMQRLPACDGTVEIKSAIGKDSRDKSWMKQVSFGGGGGGFYLDGAGSGSRERFGKAEGGRSFLNNGTGGSGGYHTTDGGFGGGGGSTGFSGSGGSGGGGGYEGGTNRGDWDQWSLCVAGGSSFNNGTERNGTSGANSGHGYAVITLLGKGIVLTKRPKDKDEGLSAEGNSTTVSRSQFQKLRNEFDGLIKVVGRLQGKLNRMEKKHNILKEKFNKYVHSNDKKRKKTNIPSRKDPST
ncbi:keratin, type II cytoskeletal 2 epidermal [Lingula anatina]|uniref:receptor protein-tyrosine kinase n=1 Tax=Lingula anatina TaxID=7574 RepID=A0A1S3JTH3_LINAN|nr:keratin, type II cytoskeletal 2 epidermal [Lingula anatina]|eukprot:XP_013413411.1 keratin, type II cytoskeletal 2 epidermal [Lingula anatina]